MTLKEKAEAKGKRLLIESFCYEKEKLPENFEYFDKPKLIESHGNKYEGLAIIRDFPVSKFTVGLNGRIYPKSEWSKKEIKEQAEGSYAFCNHQDDPDMKTVWGIWENFRVREKDVVADLILIEEKPVRILKSTPKAKLFCSTVGFGNVDSDGIVSDFEIETNHLADIVAMPSNINAMVSFAEMEILDTENKIEEQKIKESTNIKDRNKVKENESFTNNKINEKSEVKSSMDLHEKNFRLHVKDEIEKAKTNKNLTEAIQRLHSVNEEIPESFKDLKESIIKESEFIKQKLDEKISNSIKETEDIKKEHLKLKEDYEELSKNYKKAEEIITNSSKVIKESKGLDEELKTAAKKLAFFESEIQTLDHNVKVRESDLNKTLHRVKFLEENNKIADENEKIFESDLKSALEDITLMEKDLEKISKERDGFKSQLGETQEKYKKAYQHIKKLESELKKTGYIFEEDESSEEKSEMQPVDYSNTDFIEAPAKEEETEETGEEKEKMATEVDGLKVETIITEVGSEDDYEIKDEDLVPSEAEVKESIKKAYNTNITKYPSLKNIKENILTSKNVVEAMSKMKKYLKNKPSFKESYKQPVLKNVNKEDVWMSF